MALPSADIIIHGRRISQSETSVRGLTVKVLLGGDKNVTFLHQYFRLLLDVLNKDCRRSISAILTWVLENVKISARPLNSIGN